MVPVFVWLSGRRGADITAQTVTIRKPGIRKAAPCINWDAMEQQGFSEGQQQIRDAQLQSGLTLSGGEPFLQVEPLLEIVRTAKEKQLNIWAYSGFTYEELLADERKKRLLVQLDVLVDGKFVNELKDYRLVFKGSRNQRIIDVQKSLQSGSVILSEKDEQNQKLKEEDMINA